MHRYRSRQIFGGAKVFARISPNLPEKFLGHFLREHFLKQAFFWDDILNNVFMLFCQHWAPFFSNQTRLEAIFSQIFRDFAKVFTNFAQISMNLTRIFRDYARIFTKSKLLGVRLHRLHPCFLHH